MHTLVAELAEQFLRDYFPSVLAELALVLTVRLPSFSRTESRKKAPADVLLHAYSSRWARPCSRRGRSRSCRAQGTQGTSAVSEIRGIPLGAAGTRGVGKPPISGDTGKASGRGEKGAGEGGGEGQLAGGGGQARARRKIIGEHLPDSEICESKGPIPKFFAPLKLFRDRLEAVLALTGLNLLLYSFFGDGLEMLLHGQRYLITFNGFHETTMLYDQCDLHACRGVLISVTIELFQPPSRIYVQPVLGGPSGGDLPCTQYTR